MLNSGDGNFRLIIRTGEQHTFTGHLRNQIQGGLLTQSGVHVTGPYGEGFPESFNSLPAFAFVVGGVGITPALSLIPSLLQRTPAPEIRLIWYVRNEELVKECLPYLEMLSEHHRTVSVSAITPKEKRAPVPHWLSQTEAELLRAGHNTAGLFVCGPSSLASDVLKASSQTKGSFLWHFHTETFRFLLLSP
eukprot:gnl/MRDRNA2_/MRDRNA2_68287_c0_seq1.p1 gnl/MRDRNA2_/MRDRNA2_68287_c0~~gnl/MRDRNA2_/MRDRNA2_68287_c0_seq1.p1  ORF type:complete len:219 (-),score=20.35 gnl/MRDRNA2_/MRDRNA2_68287_c0_seq1:102-674(-)